MVYPPTNPDPWMSFCNCSFVWRHLNHWLASPSMFTCPLILLKHFYLSCCSLWRSWSLRGHVCVRPLGRTVTLQLHTCCYNRPSGSVFLLHSVSVKGNHSHRRALFYCGCFISFIWWNTADRVSAKKLTFRPFFYKQPLLLRGGAVEVVKAAGYFPSPSPGCDQTVLYSGCSCLGLCDRQEAVAGTLSTVSPDRLRPLRDLMLT